MPPKKPAPGAKQMPDTATAVMFREDETDDGWIVLDTGAGAATMPKPPRGKPPRPPRSSNRKPSSTATTAAASVGRPFDPSPDALVARYLPLRRALRCDALPPQIHDADVYGSHPAFLASVYAAADDADDDRSEWFFFVCRGRGLGGSGAPAAARTAWPGRRTSAAPAPAPRASSTATPSGTTRTPREASAARETEWRMDEYGDHDGHDDCHGAGAIDMVVCKVYPARGGALHNSLRDGAAAKRAVDAGVKPQVLVQLYLASVSAGDSLRCRMHPATDVFAAHPAVLTSVLPAANDRFEWFFAVRRVRGDDGGTARSRRAGQGQYVPVAPCPCRGVRDGKGRELGYRRVFRYREDDEAVRHASRTAWWMEEYGFRAQFPYGEHGKDVVLLVYKLYLRMTHR
ncbi:hypothetical protein EJB05_38812, partial [Eragrostis curvula]